MKWLRHSLPILFLIAIGCGTDPPAGEIEEDSPPQLQIPDQASLTAEVGGDATAAVEIANGGDRTLHVELEVTAEWLALSPDEFSVTRGESSDVSLTASCEEEGQWSTEVEVRSNDPDLSVASLLVSLTCTTPGDPDPDPDPDPEIGSLTVSIEGLPDGLDADVTVTGPDEYSAVLTADQTLEDLATGDYQIEASSVWTDDLRREFLPEPASSTVTVADDEETSLTIRYDLVLAELVVAFEGLPDGVDGQATLTGPDDFDETITDDTILDLPPGDYQIDGLAVEFEGVTYLPGPLVTAELSSGDIYETTVHYEANVGTLAVTVDGLPDGTDHAIEVVDGDGNATDLPQTGETTLAPGDYDLVVHDVLDGLSTYTGDAATITIELGEETTATITYDLVLASLSINFDGLPNSVDGQATLTGPDDFSEAIDGDTTLDLAPGNYEIAGAAVTPTTGTTYAPDAAQNIELSSGDDDTLTVTYDLVTGSLALEVTGLPQPLEPIAQVEGTDVDATLTGTEELSDLAPGDYTVTFQPIEDNGTTYSPDPDAVTVSVTSGSTASATTGYSIVPGALTVTATGLPDGARFDATVTGPTTVDPLTDIQPLDGGITVDDLEPGSYTVTFEEVQEPGAIYRASPASVEVSVSSDATADAESAYAVVPGELSLTSNFPSSMSFEVILRQGSTTSATATIAGGDTITFDLDPGDYSVELNELIVDEWGNEYLEDDLLGFDEAIAVLSDQTTDASIEGLAPSMVQTGANDGPASLREVIDRVNADTVITFADDVLQVSLVDQAITIDKPLTIHGHDGQWTTVSADGTHRIFEIALTEGEVVLQALHLTGGYHLDGNSTTGGGAIESIGDLTLFDVELSHNLSDNGGGGAVRVNGKLTAHGVYAHNNETTDLWGDGGAIHVDGQAEISASLFRANEAEWWGGALYLDTNDEASTITTSVFDNNYAWRRGGAIDLVGESQVTIESTSFLRNQTDPGSGGAIRTGTLLVLTNSTLYDNSSGFNGGALTLGFNATATVIYSTIVNNRASNEGPAIYWTGSGGALTLSHNLIADNGGPDQSELQFDQTYSSSFESLGYNLITRMTEDLIDFTSSDITGTLDTPIDAHIGAFGDYGGPTSTISVFPESPAHQAVPAADCVDPDGAPVTEDQRGFSRPVDSLCTIGAWQTQGPDDPTEPAWTTIETFDNATELAANTYLTASFTGVDGFTWDYQDTASALTTSGGDYQIDGQGALLRQDTRGVNDRYGRLFVEGLPAGVREIAFDYRVAHTNTNSRSLRVTLDGDTDSAVTTDTFGTDASTHDEVYTLVIDDLSFNDVFTLEIETLGSQVTVDNIRWR